MAEPARDRISTRLWRLPGQLLLALTNATALLVIVAAILVIVVLARLDRFAGSVVATMTEAVLSKVDLPQKDALADLRTLTAEVRALGSALREIKAAENPRLQSEIERLKEALAALATSVDRLREARSMLTNEAIGQLGRSAADALVKLRDCSPHGTRVVPEWVGRIGQIPAEPIGSESQFKSNGTRGH
jgi:hypothetical protein